MRALADAGAQVAALSRSGGDPGVPGALAIACDLRDRAGVFEAVDRTVSRFGRLDIVVPNAGVGSYGPFLELSPEDVDEMIDVNVKGTLYTLQATLPHLLASPAADVVIIASEAVPPRPAGGVGVQRLEVRPGGPRPLPRPRAARARRAAAPTCAPEGWPPASPSDAAATRSTRWG